VKKLRGACLSCLARLMPQQQPATDISNLQQTGAPVSSLPVHNSAIQVHTAGGWF